MANNNEKEIDTQPLQYYLLKTSLDTCLKKRQKIYYFDFFTKNSYLKTNKHKKRIDTSCQLRLNLNQNTPALHLRRCYPRLKAGVKGASVCSKTAHRWLGFRFKNKKLYTWCKTKHVTEKKEFYYKKNKYHRYNNGASKAYLGFAQTARPLLSCSRILLTTICQHQKLPVYPDKSNQSIRFSRNRIRKQILPILKLFCNPQIEDSFFKFADIVAREEIFLSSFLLFLRKNNK